MAADLLGCFSATAQDVVPWSREGLLDHIMACIVTYDLVGCAARLALLGRGTSEPAWLFHQPFNIVDWPYFRALLKFQRPDTKDEDIPHRTKVTETVVTTAKSVQQRIKERYRVRR
jgi:hypothetical protein